MSTPLVTAVIPTRNRNVLVCRAIKSALTQTYPRIEVVVVVDGPDPETIEAVNAIADERVRLLTSPRSIGGSEARNVGVRAASGEYIALLDDDDFWLSTKIEKQVALISGCGDHEVLAVTRYIRCCDGHPDEIWPVRLPGEQEPLSQFMFSSRCGFQTPVFLAPRGLLLEVPFTTGLKKHQDWDWLLRIACRPKFKLMIVDEALARVTVWPTASTASMSRQPDWQFTADWGKKMLNLGLMTRKAYGLLLVKVCLQNACGQSASSTIVLSILVDLLLSGDPSMITILDAMAVVTIPIKLRQLLRAKWLASAARMSRLKLQIGH